MAFAVRRLFPLGRPEWTFSALLIAAAAVVRAGVDPPDVALSFAIYYQLASAFTAAAVIAFLVVLGEALLDGIPATDRRHGRLIWRCASVAVALTLFVTVRPPLATPLTRALEASALSLAATIALLALFLPVAGMLRLRELFAIAARVGSYWLPVFVYIGTSATFMGATSMRTPLVIDPVLMRMDLSFGFSPSESLFAWEIDLGWVRWISTWGYPLLGALIFGVSARLHLAGAAAQTRRCLLALSLVGVFGLISYHFAPAVGPLHAFPDLFERPALTPEGAAIADTRHVEIVHGPDTMPGGTRHPRNVMPSLHTAFTLAALLAAWNWRRRFFWLCLPLGIAQVFTALTLCVHYLVDIVAAVPFALGCWFLADWLVRRSPLTGEESLPELGRARSPAALPIFVVSLAVALTALLIWARFAPLEPWVAWLLVGVIAGAPAWCARRALRRPYRARGNETGPAPTAPTDWRGRLLTGAVFCSGGTGLVLEQIYEKYLSTVLGASRPAAMIVLTVFFCGLALGAWLCPKAAAGAPRRLAALELFIAAWAALVGGTFFACDRLLGGWLAAADSSGWSLSGVRTVIAVLWILPPTLAMGAQLPTLAAVLDGNRRWCRRGIAGFYAVNLAGACVFTIATPVLLFNVVGADGALWCVAGIAAIMGLALWVALPPADATAVPSPTGTSRAAPSALAVAWAAGFGIFALEVGWFHLISAVCGASTYSFSLLLAVVLLGLAIGGGWARRFPAGGMGSTLAWLLIALVLGNALWPWAGRMMADTRAVLNVGWFWGGEMIKFGVVAMVALPSAALAGRIFPLLLLQLGTHSAHSRAVGGLCVANVAGCVTGALLTGGVLIPRFGVERTLSALAVLVALGWFAAATRRPWKWQILTPGAVGLTLLLLLPAWNRLALTSGHGVYLRPQFAPDVTLAYFHEDFRTGFVTVVESARPGGGSPVKTLLQNGKFDANDAGEMPAQIGFGLVAALHAPALDRALVIGCGSGQTASIIARLGFHHVDIAELSPAHLAAARAEFSRINHGVLDRSGVTVHVEDGRNLLLRSRDRYDVIQVELTSIWFAGATNLYSREFYALARQRLSPSGVLVQWIQLHHLTPAEIGSVLATARSQFPFVSIWRAGTQACLLASDSPPQLNAAAWAAWAGSGDLSAERRLTGLIAPKDFAAESLLSPAGLDDRLEHSRFVINTDRNRWLEFQSPKHYLSRRDDDTENLRWLTGDAELKP